MGVLAASRRSLLVWAVLAFSERELWGWVPRRDSGLADWAVWRLLVPLAAVLQVLRPFARDHTLDRDMERTRLLRPAGLGPVRVARPPPPVAPRQPVR